ncbi:MAG: DNA repair protein RecO [Pedosphaera sp.]|nr:DNA repair protein RecO [Pedosphaera sp.]MSU42496.1 DNA repair protein RecO [Pedosphaera sp.]
MDITTSGIVLRVRPLTETSLILHWLTRDHGRIATVAKGARRPKSPFRGKLDLFHAANFSFHRSRRSALHTLREVALINAHVHLRREFLHLQQAAYAAVFIEQTTEEDTPLPEAFDLFAGLLAHLSTCAPTANTVLAFELKCLAVLGLAPRLDESRLAADTQHALTALCESDWESVAQLKMTAAQVGEASQFLHGFLIYHLGRIPKGRAEALSC